MRIIILIIHYHSSCIIHPSCIMYSQYSSFAHHVSCIIYNVSFVTKVMPHPSFIIVHCSLPPLLKSSFMTVYCYSPVIIHYILTQYSALLIHSSSSIMNAPNLFFNRHTLGFSSKNAIIVPSFHPSHGW